MKSNILFTADTHFGHANIIRYCNRPFSNPEEMDEELIKRWNSVCDAESVVYHLGDVFFGNHFHKWERILASLKFAHLYVIKGNHDRNFAQWFNRNRPKGITFLDSHFETKIQDIDFTLNHYAMRVWNKSHHGAYHLYGHSHGTLPDDSTSRSFDVGVDCHNFTPITLEKVIEIMDSKNWKKSF